MYSTDICVYVRIHMMHMYVCMYVCIPHGVCMYVCMYAHVHVYVDLHVHVYECTRMRMYVCTGTSIKSGD